jgi:WD40 repeat protein
METTEKPPGSQIVLSGGAGASGSNALALRSAKLVARGLRDLARESNWTCKPAFVGKASKVSVSSTGLVCAISAESRNSPPRVVIHDLHNSYGQLALAVPGETPALAKHLPAAFAWSSSGRYLAGAWAAWQPEIHVFDLEGKEFIGSFGKFQQPPSHLAWSRDASYVAAATSGGKLASLRLWASGTNGSHIQDSPLGHAGIPDWLERQTYEAEFGEEGAFHGYGKTAFSPDGKSLASVIEIQGEWADDSIFLAGAPDLKRLKSFQVQGHISDISWLPAGDALVYCASAQAYRLDLSILQSDPLPFGAELCVAHPTLPLVACYISWLKDSAKGRLFIADLRSGARYDECEADGVSEIRWSENGARAYAVAKDGMAYIYEPDVL